MTFPYADKFGLLVCHLLIKAAEHGWTPERFDRELARGVRNLARRLAKRTTTILP